MNRSWLQSFFCVIPFPPAVNKMSIITSNWNIFLFKNLYAYRGNDIIYNSKIGFKRGCVSQMEYIEHLQSNGEHFWQIFWHILSTTLSSKKVTWNAHSILARLQPWITTPIKMGSHISNVPEESLTFEGKTVVFSGQ